MAQTQAQKFAKKTRKQKVYNTKKKTKTVLKRGGNNLLTNWINLQIQKKTIGAFCFFCDDKDKNKKNWFGLNERWNDYFTKK